MVRTTCRAIRSLVGQEAPALQGVRVPQPLVTQYIVPAMFGLTLPSALTHLFLTWHTKLLLLSMRTRIDRSAPDEGLDIALTVMDNNGWFVASLATLQQLQILRTSLSEAIFYRRNPHFLPACTSTAHRTTHCATLIDYPVLTRTTHAGASRRRSPLPKQ